MSIRAIQEATSSETIISNKEQKYFIEGPFLQSNTLNANRRVYPKPVLQETVSFYKERFILPKKALGERDHPDLSRCVSEKEAFERYTTVRVENASHVITEMEFDGDDVYGKAEILETASGKDVLALIKAGLPIHVSSRGIGDFLQKESHVEIKSGFRLITVDIVANPSSPGCILKAIKESQEWIWEKDFFSLNKKEEIKRKEIFSEQEAQEYFSIFKNFLNSLK